MQTIHPDRDSALVELHEVSRTYRSRIYPYSWWRNLLSPQFTDHPALSKINLQIHAGQCLGLVGPNGAGKSTLVKLLTGILQPDSGQLSVLGYVPGKRQVAMLSQMAVLFGHKTAMWWDLPVQHSFDAVQKIYRTPKEQFVCDAGKYSQLLQVDHLMQRTVRQLSLGERIKFELVLALAHQPKVLLLDEPTIGVDMESKQQIRKLIKQVLSDKQIAVLLTSHDVNDLLGCCSHIALLHEGVMFYHSTLPDLLEQFNLDINNSKEFEDNLIASFKARRSDGQEIEFGTHIQTSSVAEESDDD